MDDKKKSEKRDNSPAEEDHQTKRGRTSEEFVAEHSKLTHWAEHVVDQVPEFNATRNELIQLVKFWTETALDISYFIFLTTQVGGRELRRRAFADLRISLIA